MSNTSYEKCRFCFMVMNVASQSGDAGNGARINPVAVNYSQDAGVFESLEGGGSVVW